MTDLFSKTNLNEKQKFLHKVLKLISIFWLIFITLEVKPQ
jgi:hypothetical protein